MKKLALCLSAMMMLSAFASCDNNNSDNQENSESTTTATTETSTKAETNAISGVYKGSQASSKFTNVETIVLLRNDNTYERRTTYTGEEIETVVNRGNYTLDTDNSIVTLKVDGSSVSPTYKVDGNTLTLIDNDLKDKTGEFSNPYVLPLVELGDIAGSYVKGENGKKGYYDEMTIADLGEGMYKVTITSGNAKKGCSFEGKGKFEDGRIVINLSDIDKDLKSKAIVELAGKRAFVYSDDPDSHYDLHFFCGGGGTIQGTYERE